jgi:hypothetical protein
VKYLGVRLVRDKSLTTENKLDYIQQNSLVAEDGSSIFFGGGRYEKKH